ncbi:rhodanese-like domain-containing protein [Companilactobacillus allii]|uniref:Sulfurtransferase n=1 Tax=Companilactobacillus allii TaxID=1847728 RepID=A0A1P8Q3Z5_9LACO|nr:rhodanese-like domain-containing protein [Companilactobacillus allii]APX72563.1 sulfurtransferase [Companilactobacillus allii]USQ69665.1 rhodanese-like domain-containing protein [Companilactobacillus allii]
MQIINTILYIVVIGYLVYLAGSWLYYFIKGRQINGALSGEEFESTMRKAQIIDLREKNTFDAKHILGARNLPYTQLKYKEDELRPDLPVYLYEDRKSVSIRAAVKLQKKGFTDIKWLDERFSDWEGKTKKTNKL